MGTKAKKKKKILGYTIDPSLDKYNHMVMFPEKLAKANERLKKAGLPPEITKKRGKLG